MSFVSSSGVWPCLCLAWASCCFLCFRGGLRKHVQCCFATRQQARGYPWEVARRLHSMVEIWVLRMGCAFVGCYSYLCQVHLCCWTGVDSAISLREQVATARLHSSVCGAIHGSCALLLAFQESLQIWARWDCWNQSYLLRLVVALLLWTSFGRCSGQSSVY